MKEYSWYTLQFTPKEYIINKIVELERKIYEMFEEYELQSEIAIFIPRDMNFIHQSRYIPPKTVKLIEPILIQYGATKCEEPNFDSVNILLGIENESKEFFKHRTIIE